MIKLTANNGVFARYKDGVFDCGTTICLPDNADISEWIEFTSRDVAKETFGYIEPETNRDIDEGEIKK